MPQRWLSLWLMALAPAAASCGMPDGLVDNDQDGFILKPAECAEGDEASPVGVCDQPFDCDDGAADVYPGAEESFGGDGAGRDDDCDGLTDEGAQSPTPTATTPPQSHTPTASPIPPSATPSPTATVTPRPPTASPTAAPTPIPTAAPTLRPPTPSPDETATAQPPTASPIPPSPSAPQTATPTPIPTAPPTPGDADGDGYANDVDCDDHDRNTYPGATEFCDEADDDCDGRIDEGQTLTVYTDADGDGFGDPGTETQGCGGPDLAFNGKDCDDSNAAIFPEAAETCDSVDQDCDDSIDEDPTDGTVWYHDGDRDAYGADDSSIIACDAPREYVAQGGDCDDDDFTIHPSATDDLDAVDSDCDGCIDEAGIATQVAIVSEVQADPFETPLAAHQYVEIYNPSSQPIDLEGWELRADNGSAVRTLQVFHDQRDGLTGTVVPAGGFLLVVQTAPSFTVGWDVDTYIHVEGTPYVLGDREFVRLVYTCSEEPKLVHTFGYDLGQLDDHKTGASVMLDLECLAVSRTEVKCDSTTRYGEEGKSRGTPSATNDSCGCLSSEEP